MSTDPTLPAGFVYLPGFDMLNGVYVTHFTGIYDFPAATQKACQVNCDNPALNAFCHNSTNGNLWVACLVDCKQSMPNSHILFAF